ncbi:MAG: hypothetical protein N2043_09715 [Ignavibacterium sp.]|nr:hypothetical protein [Ignavibacterium sp.]
MSVITLTEFKVFNKISTDDVSLDIFLQDIIEYAQAQAENYCGVKFELKEYVELYDGDQSNVLILNNYPIKNIKKIRMFDGVNWNLLVSGIDYNRLLFDEHRIILDGGIFQKGIKNYEITYEAGYTENEMPLDIRLGILELASVIFSESKQGDGTLLVNSKNKGQIGLTESYDKDIENKILTSRFKRYRKHNV